MIRLWGPRLLLLGFGNVGRHRALPVGLGRGLRAGQAEVAQRRRSRRGEQSGSGNYGGKAKGKGRPAHYQGTAWREALNRL